jgi:hypothetical protein
MAKVLISPLLFVSLQPLLMTIMVGMKHKGIICGILAAVCYGTNPFGALPLYEEGVNTASVLFYRFFMAVLMLAIMLIVQRKSFSVTKGELKVLGSLGMLLQHPASRITRVSTLWMPVLPLPFCLSIL